VYEFQREIIEEVLIMTRHIKRACSVFLAVMMVAMYIPVIATVSVPASAFVPNTIPIYQDTSGT
jgi:hypothetical protein